VRQGLTRDVLPYCTTRARVRLLNLLLQPPPAALAPTTTALVRELVSSAPASERFALMTALIDAGLDTRAALLLDGEERQAWLAQFAIDAPPASMARRANERAAVLAYATGDATEPPLDAAADLLAYSNAARAAAS
jgi:hypothetical protein